MPPLLLLLPLPLLKPSARPGGRLPPPAAFERLVSFTFTFLLRVRAATEAPPLPAPALALPPCAFAPPQASGSLMTPR